ncbi:acyltransferase family protein [Arenimonas oryziterrae]|uniref:Acyltransferase 3 domain-containing protein n=1 Tax=Arenimonas oryziterrae DSM 21050 = YC6267 TaxID=1121015 RepID=A0A091AYT5_9GAMM|nr:acyltransferase family protein [Arenimonas oryziterrae]KFN44427.1 hypothetical protein N789_00030 [Arenimonas oryziterrae DSM 21050 = YC6267]
MNFTNDRHAGERLHGLDALRGFALLLGVIFHATMSFLPGPQIWFVRDADPSVTLGLLFFVTHLFRMTTFFLIAGFFAHMSFHRLGTNAFVRDRLKRIGLPLVVGWPLVFGSILVVIIGSAIAANAGAPPPHAPPPPAFTPSSFPLTHLWFLYVLLIFYAISLLGRRVIRALDRQGRFVAWTDRMLRSMLGPWAAVVLAIPLVVTLMLRAHWLPWFGIPTPDQSLYPNAVALFGYGTAFVFGWLLHRQGSLLAIIEKYWRPNLCLALLATGSCLALTGLRPSLALAPDLLTKLACAVSYALASWSWTLAVVGAALRHLSAYSAMRRYVADASYWIYLVHLPLLMALQSLAAGLPWAWWLKFPMILIVAFALMFASYHGCVRHTFVGAVLNGRRKPRGPAVETTKDCAVTPNL